MKSPLKRRLAEGQSVFGSFAFLPSPDVVEIMGHAGLDYVIIDLEHSPKNWSDVANMIRAAELHGMAALVRIRENSEKAILEVLELGATGVVVPFVQTAEDVARAARALLYPPAGQRGTCTLTRAARYGGLRSGFVAHALRQNEDVVLVAQIEDRQGVENIEAIVACSPGLDALVIGRSDLASSLGAPGQVEHPAVIEATHRVIAATQAGARKVPPGVGLYSPGEAARWIDAGCRMFFYSADTAMLLNAARAAADGFRAALDEKR